MKTLSGNPLTKIGIGSFGIGGRGHRDVALTELQEDIVYIDALVYTLQKGINFTEIALGYGHGNAMRLFKEALAISGIARKDIFVTNSFYPRDFPSFATVQQDVDSFYQIMETEYADSTLVTQSLVLKFGKEAIYTMLHRLLDSDKTRYISLSNASPAFIKEFKNEFDEKFYAHEGHLSFEVRALQDKGVFTTCDELGVKNIIWRPLGRNKTLGRNWPLLIELSKKYNKSQSQIILNWLCHLGYSPMVLALDKKHIAENLSATEFELSEEEYQRITDFFPSNYNPPSVHWDTLSTDDDIVILVNEFDKHINSS
jgi:diketogulonate reductase-like aldo/keto reductase